MNTIDFDNEDWGFLAQQCVEKILRALLVLQDVEPPLTHPLRWGTLGRCGEGPELPRLAVSDAEAGCTTSLGLSRLSWLACRVGPLRRQDQAALERFDAFISRPDLCWVELSASVVEQATTFRARHNLRTPDVLQAASCLHLDTDALIITADSAFARVSGLSLALVS